MVWASQKCWLNPLYSTQLWLEWWHVEADAAFYAGNQLSKSRRSPDSGHRGRLVGVKLSGARRRHNSITREPRSLLFPKARGIVWRLPVPAPPTTHGFKYRLVYVVDGARVVGFDNERGKGDHCHLDGKEFPYRFATIDQLIEDFIKEVDKRRTR